MFRHTGFYVYSQHKNIQMDKRISTLIFIYVIYLLIALTMTFFPNGQKVMTMLLFGGGGIGILLIFFFVWQQSRVRD